MAMFFLDVRREARRLLKEMGMEESERVPLSQVARHLNATLEYVESDKIDGLCMRVGDESLIKIKKGAGKERTRFSVAHELAHLHLGHEMAFSWEGKLTKDRGIESRANAWASEILMPIVAVKRLAWNHSVYELAEIFGVSIEAMSYRLGNIGLTPRRRSHPTTPAMEATL